MSFSHISRRVSGAEANGFIEIRICRFKGNLVEFVDLAVRHFILTHEIAISKRLLTHFGIFFCQLAELQILGINHILQRFDFLVQRIEAIKLLCNQAVNRWIFRHIINLHRLNKTLHTIRKLKMVESMYCFSVKRRSLFLTQRILNNEFVVETSAKRHHGCANDNVACTEGLA